MATITEALEAKMVLDTKVFREEIKKAQRSTTQGSNVMMAAWNQVGFSITGVISKMNQLSQSALQLGFRFEEEMAAVNSLIANESAPVIEKMGNDVLVLAEKLGRSPVQIAEALYQEISAGAADAEGDLNKFTETVIKTAIAGRATVKEAATLMVQSMNAYGLSLEDAGRISDNFFNIVKFGITTFPELASASSRVIPIAKTAGLAMEDWGAAAAVLTQNSFSTDQAMTALRSTINSVLKPTAGASIEAKRLGIDFSSSALKAKGLVGVMQEVSDKADGNVDALNKLFPNMRAFGAATVLSGVGLDKFKSNITAFTTEVGAMEDAYRVMTDTTQFAIDKQISGIQSLTIQIVKDLGPTIIALAESWGDVAKGFLTWVKDSRVLIRTINAVAGAFHGFRTIVLAGTAAIVDTAGRLVFAWENAGNMLTIVWEKVKQGALGLSSTITSTVAAIIQKLESVATPLSSFDPTGVLSGVASSLQKATNAVDSSTNKIEREIRESQKVIDQATKAMGESLEDNFLIKLANEVGKEAKAAADKTKKAFNVVKTGQEEIKKKVQETAKAGKAVGELFNQGEIDKVVAAKRTADEIQNQIQKTKEFAERSFKSETDTFLSELKKRVDAKTRAEEKLQEIGVARARQAEGFEERLWAITTAGLTDAGKRLNKFGIAKTFESRASEAGQRNDFSEQKRLAEKAQSQFEEIALRTDIPEEERRKAIEGFKRTQNVIQRAFAGQQDEQKKIIENNQKNIDSISKQLEDLQKQAIVKLQFLVDNDAAKSQIQKMKDLINDVASDTKKLSNIEIPKVEKLIPKEPPVPDIGKIQQVQRERIRGVNDHQKAIEELKEKLMQMQTQAKARLKLLIDTGGTEQEIDRTKALLDRLKQKMQDVGSVTIPKLAELPQIDATEQIRKIEEVSNATKQATSLKIGEMDRLLAKRHVLEESFDGEFKIQIVTSNAVKKLMDLGLNIREIHAILSEENKLGDLETERIVAKLTHVGLTVRQIRDVLSTKNVFGELATDNSIKKLIDLGLTVREIKKVLSEEHEFGEINTDNIDLVLDAVGQDINKLRFLLRSEDKIRLDASDAVLEFQKLGGSVRQFQKAVNAIVTGLPLELQGTNEVKKKITNIEEQTKKLQNTLNKTNKTDIIQEALFKEASEQLKSLELQLDGFTTKVQNTQKDFQFIDTDDASRDVAKLQDLLQFLDQFTEQTKSRFQFILDTTGADEQTNKLKGLLSFLNEFTEVAKAQFDLSIGTDVAKEQIDLFLKELGREAQSEFNLAVETGAATQEIKKLSELVELLKTESEVTPLSIISTKDTFEKLNAVQDKANTLKRVVEQDAFDLKFKADLADIEKRINQFKNIQEQKKLDLELKIKNKKDTGKEIDQLRNTQEKNNVDLNVMTNTIDAKAKIDQLRQTQETKKVAIGLDTNIPEIKKKLDVFKLGEEQDGMKLELLPGFERTKDKLDIFRKTEEQKKLDLEFTAQVIKMGETLDIFRNKQTQEKVELEGKIDTNKTENQLDIVRQTQEQKILGLTADTSVEEISNKINGFRSAQEKPIIHLRAAPDIASAQEQLSVFRNKEEQRLIDLSLTADTIKIEEKINTTRQKQESNHVRMQLAIDQASAVGDLRAFKKAQSENLGMDVAVKKTEAINELDTLREAQKQSPINIITTSNTGQAVTEMEAMQQQMQRLLNEPLIPNVDTKNITIPEMMNQEDNQRQQIENINERENAVEGLVQELNTLTNLSSITIDINLNTTQARMQIEQLRNQMANTNIPLSSTPTTMQTPIVQQTTPTIPQPIAMQQAAQTLLSNPDIPQAQQQQIQQQIPQQQGPAIGTVNNSIKIEPKQQMTRQEVRNIANQIAEMTTRKFDSTKSTGSGRVTPGSGKTNTF